MDYKINFDEPIPQMIERLKQEHIDFESTLEKITKYIDENKIEDALETLHNLSNLIIKHAVEEEARLMRVIMQKAKEESPDSIKIMQEHNWVVDFLKHKLQNTDNDIHQQYPQLQEKIKSEINEFIANLKIIFWRKNKLYSLLH